MHPLNPDEWHALELGWARTFWQLKGIGKAVLMI